MKNLILILFLIISASANAASLQKGAIVCETKEEYNQLTKAKKDKDTHSYNYLMDSKCMEMPECYPCTILSKKHPVKVRFYIGTSAMEVYTNIKNVK